LLHQRFPSLTIFDLLSEIFGKNIGNLGKIAYILFFVINAIYTVMLFGRMMNLWILFDTPVWITLLLMIAIGVYCAQKKLRVVARFFTAVSILLVVSVFLLSHVLKDVNYLFILPMGDSGLPSILKGAAMALPAFGGFEVALVIFPYTIGNPAKKLKVSLIVIGLITLFYIFITFVSLTFLGPSVMKFIPRPPLYILKYQTFHVVERTDLLFLSIWTVYMVTTLIMYLYLTSAGITHLLKKSDHSRVVPYVAMFVFIGAIFIPKNDQAIKLVSEYYKMIAPVFHFGFPVILLLLSFILGKKESQIGTQS
jgi:spore germination protein (amino acid permease)